MKYGSVNAATMPLGWRHWWITGVAALGQMIGCGVATVAGVIIPMLNLLLHPELSWLMQGLIGGADLVGICIGSLLFGRLSDRYGYLFFFRLCPAIVALSSLIAILVPDVYVLIVCLFICGVGIGGEYSLDGDYITDLMPDRYRSLMVGFAKMSSAFGNIVGAALCLWMLLAWRDASRWPDLMWIVAGTAALMLLLRIRFFESPGWLLSKGRVADAEAAVKKFLGKDVYLTPPLSQGQPPRRSGRQLGLSRFVRANWKKVVLSGVPWACEGLGVYGFGVFLPILVLALGLEHFTPDMAPVVHIAMSVKVTLWISVIMVPGFLLGLFLLFRKRSVPVIQVWGFALCAISLALLLVSYRLQWAKWVSILAFMGFEFFLNMGPHLITYVLPPRIYPQASRGQGAGIAAAIGKLGAVAGVFLIPVLLRAGGASLVLGVSAGVMAIGALVTGVVKVRPADADSD